jgi:DNA modification methylase
MKAEILVGDVRSRLAEIPDKSVQCVVTSPPYWGLRDYGNDGQIGLEQTPQEYITEMVSVFREVWRVLSDDGVLWLNLGDSYASFRDGKAIPDTARGENKGTLVPKGSAANRMAGSFATTNIKHKDLVGIPWRVAFALQDDGWYLRQDIIWAKPNPMPESVRDRCTKSHEYIFMLTKSSRYFFDNEAIKELSVSYNPKHQQKSTINNIVGNMSDRGVTRTTEGLNLKTQAEKTKEFRNRRDVWFIPTKPFKGAHFAVMPEAIVEPCVLASSRTGDTVLDPFTGSGTVAVVALRHGRNYVGTELNPEYAEIAKNRITEAVGGLINDVVLS